MSDCIFCKIAEGEIPSEIVYKDDKIVVFKDTAPQAPVHVLMVPRRHIKSLDELSDGDSELISYMMLKIKDIAKDLGFDNGYRVVINTGEDGQQSVKHLHIHILGGRKFSWPPG